MKCQNCGQIYRESEYGHYCNVDCYIEGMTILHDGAVGSRRRNNIMICSPIMVKHKVICKFCTQRLKKIITGKCNTIFEKVESIRYEG